MSSSEVKFSPLVFTNDNLTINTSLLDRAIRGLEKGNVWIALNNTSTDIQVIQKDSCPLRGIKGLLRSCGWDWYSHLDSWNVLKHLETRDWTAIDSTTTDHFYKLFEQCIHHKYPVADLKPRLRQSEIPHQEEVHSQSAVYLEEDSPVAPLIAIRSPQPSVTEIDENGNTQLHRAILDRQQENVHPKEVLARTGREIVRLLKLGVDPTVQNQKGDTILHLITDLHYWSFEHDQLVQILLTYGAKANVPNKQGVTALHRIIEAKPSASIVEPLIKEGLADVNAPDHKGNTALHKAAYTNRSLGGFFNKKLARVLLQNGAKVDIPNRAGNTPLHVAITSQGDVEKAVLFFCGEGHANVNAQNKDGDTPLHLLASFNQWDIEGHRKIVESLLSRGADKTLVNKKGELPIHKAYKRSGSEVIDLLETEDIEVIDSNEQTPLHLAARDSRRNIDEFMRIFAKSKDIMAIDKFGNTALHNAASSGFYEAVEFLIANKVPMDTPNAEGNSPLYLAIWGLLNESYSEISSDYKLNEMEEIITVLHSAKTGSPKQVRFKLDPRFMQLHYNVLRRIINLLLDSGANPYQGNKKEESPVDHCFNWAEIFSTFNTADFFRRVKQKLN
jgi:ankyrin repeat protein